MKLTAPITPPPPPHGQRYPPKGSRCPPCSVSAPPKPGAADVGWSSARPRPRGRSGRSSRALPPQHRPGAQVRPCHRAQCRRCRGSRRRVVHSRDHAAGPGEGTPDLVPGVPLHDHAVPPLQRQPPRGDGRGRGAVRPRGAGPRRRRPGRPRPDARRLRFADAARAGGPAPAGRAGAATDGRERTPRSAAERTVDAGVPRAGGPRRGFPRRAPPAVRDRRVRWGAGAARALRPRHVAGRPRPSRRRARRHVREVHRGHRGADRGQPLAAGDPPLRPADRGAAGLARGRTTVPARLGFPWASRCPGSRAVLGQVHRHLGRTAGEHGRGRGRSVREARLRPDPRLGQP